MPNPRRVLVVDDNRTVAKTVATLVRLIGHYCTCAFDARTALEMATDFQPDVILMDLRMPDMDGFAAVRALRAAGCKARIVAITGFSEAVFSERPLDVGFDGFLTKPATAEQISAVVAELS